MHTFLSSIAHSIPIITFLVYYSYAQQPGNAYLERRITDLEKRVAILESKLKSSSSEKIQYSEKWKDRMLWRKLSTGMKMDQVEALLGVPEKIDGGDFTHWYFYPESPLHSHVTFYMGRLNSWKEPD